MWTLFTPHCDTVDDDLETGLTYADGTYRHVYSENQLRNLLTVYERYDEHGGQASPQLAAKHLGPRFLSEIKRAYKDVYEGNRLSGLRSRLMLVAHKCPYCGFGEVSELDHFLPRSAYNALAIYPRNLIPCCHVCNHKKGTLAGGEPEIQFPHVYLEEWPDDKFLYADVGVSANGLRVIFRLEQCVGMSDDVFARVQFHFAQLELSERYESEVTEFMASQREAIDTVADGGSGQLREYLERCHSKSIQSHGENHWRTALFAGLALSDPFVQGGYQYCFG